MSKARDLADFQGSASALTTGTLPVDRVPYVGRRNLIINGGFDVWQRGTSFSELGANTYTADRWQAYDGSGYNATVTQSLSGSGSMSGTVLKYTAGTGQTSGGIRQIIEDGKAVAEQTVTLSFYARVASGTSTISSDIVMELSGVNDEVAGDVDFDLTTSWQKFSRTYTFTTSYGASVVDNLTCSVYIKDLIGNSVRYYIANVQLELGSVATPFEHRSYGEELALCQRYYYRTGERALSLANATTTGYSYREPRSAQVTYPVEMRATPTATAVVSEQSLSGGVLLRVAKEYVTCVPANYATDIPSGDYWYGGAVLDAEL